MTSTRPSMKEIEDAATEARDAAAERSEKLDQREADMGAKIAGLERVCDGLRSKLTVKAAVNSGCEQRIIDLNRQLDAAAELVSKVEDERDEAIDAASTGRTAGRLSRLTHELGTVRRQREDAVARGEMAESDRLHWIRLHDAAEKVVAVLRKRIAAADDRVSSVLLYCSNTLDVLRGKGEDIERETHGNTDRV